MFLFVYKTFRMVINAIRGSNSPVQVGLGIAVGMMIGLIPKDSLFAFAIGLVVFATNINLLAVSLSAFGFMWIAAFLDPISHQVGYFVLTQPRFQATFLWLYEQPVIPWTRFNNTVVMGSLVIALILSYPTYLLSSSLFEKYSPKFNAVMIRFWLYRFLVGKDKTAELVGAEE